MNNEQGRIISYELCENVKIENTIRIIWSTQINRNFQIPVI
jgi:hypothetical protein